MEDEIEILLKEDFHIEDGKIKIKSTVQKNSVLIMPTPPNEEIIIDRRKKKK